MGTMAEAIGRQLDGAQALPGTTESVERYLKLKGGERGNRIADEFAIEFQTKATLQQREGSTEEDYGASFKRLLWLTVKINMEAGALSRDIHSAIAHNRNLRI